ncbi:Helix-turn-helix domain-containing protein [Amycolatopsis pretoriensis]|uniref:Helix-turn-helix domain-containing protein n=1 Tax=Amycolatopsis pretoriensis TaxID=218821 RepID=A0A1H5RH44_9PSEU|nr:Helix-turn-helix domain-containing protein [Amycolatopsis pretoriensis]
MEALGPVGERLAERLTALRRAAGLTQADLAAKLKALERPVLISALSRIEKGQRRVDVDDLVALALALGVSPNHLLLPAQPGQDLVKLAPDVTMTAGSAWRWATRDAPVPPADSFFISYSHEDGTEHARWIANLLREAGFAVWFDEWKISPGASIPALVREGVESSVASFVIVTPAYAESTGRWSSRELDMMLRQPGHGLVPVYFSKDAVPAVVGNYLGLDLVGKASEDARTLVLEAAAQLAPQVSTDR